MKGIPRAVGRDAWLRLVTATVAGVALAVAAPAAAAGDLALPDGAAVMDRFVVATGGAEAYARLVNRVMRGVLEIPAAGVSFELVRYTSRPARSAATLTSEAFGTIQRGCDGRVAWESSLMTGPRVLEGGELEGALREAFFDAVPGWREVWREATTAGIEEVDGRPCYRVELTPKLGSPQTVWFDVESGLMVKAETVVVTAMGEVPATTKVSDWQSADGVLVARRAEVVATGQARVVRITGVEHNVELPAGCFDPPADVAKLLLASASQP